MEEKEKNLIKRLKYLTKDAINEEITLNKDALSQDNVDIKRLANEIYLKRGLDVSKLNTNVTGNLINDITLAFNIFKGKEKSIKRKMIMDLIFLVIVIIFAKIPIDFVRDITYDYVSLATTNDLYYTLWHLGALLLYTLVAICIFIVFIRYFNNKYND